MMILFSCQNENKIEKENAIQNAGVDSTFSTQLDFVSDSLETKDTISTEDVKEENILEKTNVNTAYKVESISELWKTYKNSKALATKFSTNNNLDSTVYYLNLAADAAYKLSREDIATWQLNNIGYYSINEFKRRTDYDIRMQKLATFTNLKLKALYVEETKKIFAENLHILETAELYLYKAQLLDSDLEPSDRTQVIESNLEFIDWIANYISKGSRKSRIQKK